MSKIKEYFNKEFGKQKNIKILKSKNYEYKFDMRIFQATIFLIVIFMVYIFLQSGFNIKDNVYVKCDSAGMCMNPIYESNICGKQLPTNHELCVTEFLPYGYEYGKPKPKLMGYFEYIATALIILAFILNHMIHNRNTKAISELLNESDKDN